MYDMIVSKKYRVFFDDIPKEENNKEFGIDLPASLRSTNRLVENGFTLSAYHGAKNITKKLFVLITSSKLLSFKIIVESCSSFSQFAADISKITSANNLKLIMNHLSNFIKLKTLQMRRNFLNKLNLNKKC